MISPLNYLLPAPLLISGMRWSVFWPQEIDHEKAVDLSPGARNLCRFAACTGRRRCNAAGHATDRMQHLSSGIGPEFHRDGSGFDKLRVANDFWGIESTMRRIGALRYGRSRRRFLLSAGGWGYWGRDDLGAARPGSCRGKIVRLRIRMKIGKMAPRWCCSGSWC